MNKFHKTKIGPGNDDVWKWGKIRKQNVNERERKKRYERRLANRCSLLGRRNVNESYVFYDGQLILRFCL